MVSQPPNTNDGRQPIFNPESLKDVARSEEPEIDEEKTEAEKEEETRAEDFVSFGDPSKLEDVKEKTADDKEES